jgi:hypothetical protein
MNKNGWYHHEKLGVNRISCAREFTIPNMAGTSPNPEFKYPDLRPSQPNQECHTPYSSPQLLSYTTFSFSSTVSLYLIHKSTIIAEWDVSSSLFISLCYDYMLTISTAYTEHSVHRILYTLSITYTEYCIPGGQHLHNMICLPCILLIQSWPPNGASASGVPSYTINHQPPALHASSMVWSHWYFPTVAS